MILKEIKELYYHNFKLKVGYYRFRPFEKIVKNEFFYGGKIELIRKYWNK